MNNNPSEIDRFWSQLASSRRALLLLDYDGTLAPFRIERDQAIPYPGVPELLKSIQDETATRLVIISGRAISDLLPLLGMQPPPEIWGCHGWEHLPAGQEQPEIDLSQAAMAGLQQAAEWVQGQGLEGYSEDKPASLAIHWRGLPESEAGQLRDKVTAGWQPIADQSDLVIHEFNGGLELRCPGKDKGTAIRAILSSESPEIPVAFLGDDRTDEDGFAAVARRGLGVLVNNEPRTTEAAAIITPPDELLAFLRTWLTRAPRPEADLEEENR